MKGYIIKLMKTSKHNFKLLTMFGFLILIIGNNYIFTQERFTNPMAGNLEAGSVKGAFCMPEHDVWGGSVIHHEDCKYYMFANAWPANAPGGIYTTSSQIVLAVSDSPDGPYEYKKKIIPFRDKKYWDGGSAFNPALRKYNGTFYLFYTGNTYPFDRPNSNESIGKKGDTIFDIAWNNKRIGVATAKNPLGPWKRYDKPIIETRKEHWDCVLTSNAAPVIHDDGSVTLYYKSSNIPHEDRPPKKLIDGVPRFSIGVAKADHVFGTYRRLGKDDGRINIEGQFIALEDPFAWHDGDYYYMVVKNFEKEFSDENGAALYIRSEDGVNWHLPSNTAKAYSQQLTWKEGISMEVRRLEKPHILFENGKPAWLFAACNLGNINKKHCGCKSCVYNVVFKIKQ